MSESKPVKVRDPRNGLRTSATLATIFTLFGHNLFGFEQSTTHVLVGLFTGYVSAILFELLDATVNQRRAGYLGGGVKHFVDWMLSAHMTSITMTFLLYTQRDLSVLAFAVALAIGSKYFFRVELGGRPRHFMNPSNFGIAVVLLTNPFAFAPPWAYTVNLHGWQDWALPAFIFLLGFRLNLLFTRRLPLIAAWVGGTLLLGAIRSYVLGSPFAAEWSIFSSVAMVLFSFYMITDPQTSPSEPRRQVIFGFGIAVAYAALLWLHVMYTMFYAVVIVCALRGLWLYAESVLERSPVQRAPALGATPALAK